MISRCCDAPSLSLVTNLAARGVPHGAEGHNVIHDYTVVQRCGACDGGVVEHHSHDCWETGDPSSWDMYWWWRIPPADMRVLLDAMDACPSPLDSACSCAVHEGLGGPPPRAARSVETPYDKAAVPETGVRVEEGVPRWT